MNFSDTKKFVRAYGNVLFFVGGFVFDSLTMVRIDSVLDLALQVFYLATITGFMIAQERVGQGRWKPSGFLGRFWHLETEILHFCYGGLLSGYVVFYFKSTSFSRSFIFLALIAVLMIANEMPQVRKWGSLLRLGLYAFCVVSFLNYFIPVVVGRMGWLTFIAAWVLAALITHVVLKAVVRHAPDPRWLYRRLAISPVGVLAVVFTLYSLKLIPPVPLSLKYLGVFRGVQYDHGAYLLTYRKPSWYSFWKTDNRVFPAVEGDEIYSFISVFGPRRFTHRIYVRWSKWDPVKSVWRTSDRLPMNLAGGRSEGFRGFTKKENYEFGRWRVAIETEDERVLGQKTLEIQPDPAPEKRILLTRRM